MTKKNHPRLTFASEGGEVVVGLHGRTNEPITPDSHLLVRGVEMVVVEKGIQRQKMGGRGRK